MSTLGQLNKECHKFKDAAGRQWDVGLTFAVVRRIDAGDYSAVYQGPGKFSLLSNSQPSLESIFVSDAVCFAVVWAIIQPQLSRPESMVPASEWTNDNQPRVRPITEDEFCEALDGDAIAAGRAALEAALLDFFPRGRTGLSTYLRTRDALAQESAEQMEAMDPEIRTTVKELWAGALEQFRAKIRDVKTQMGMTSPPTTRDNPREADAG